MDLKDWVKDQREQRGWTQEQLAEAMSTAADEIQRQEVIAIEKGRNKGTSARIQYALRRVFGVLPPELVVAAAAPASTGAPVFGNLPGYGEAERAARARPGAALFEEQDWAAPRGWSGALSPHEVTPDFVIALATAAREARLRPGRSTEDKKLDAQLKGLATKADRRLAKQKAATARANDNGAPLVLTPATQRTRRKRPKKS